MKIIKCGGSTLKSYEDRKKLYKEIKDSNTKTILVVSAFLDCPYSTKSFKELLTGNYTYLMKEQLITLGEIISSIRVCNELLNEYVDATLLYPSELGIKVITSDKFEEIDTLDNQKLLEKVNNHKVVVIPGFIGFNQDGYMVSLQENGSDLTAMIIAKMLNVNEVYLYKDVLGLASIDPSIYKNYKLYKDVSYELMKQIILHGSNLIQNKAIDFAKDNNISIIVSHYLNHNYKTSILKLSKEKVIVFQILNKDIFIDGINNKSHIENLLEMMQLKYDYILPCNSYLKIVTSYNNEKEILNYLHNKYYQGELNGIL